MKKLTITAAVALLALLCSFKAAGPGTWMVDKNHAKVDFSISHNMTSDVEGLFKFFEATITTPGDDFAGATFDFSADTARILPAVVGLTKTVAGFKVSGVIKRSDFNIGAGFADIMLGEEITLNVNDEFDKN